ncbi:MAG: hypothetical protein HC805_02905 [Alkalinema sp. RL_2_19]|nr:hypothetical protein [Alkalinema sp. RL_2_19]
MKFDQLKPKRTNSRKAIGQMMIWSCVGMAYFNFFSSLNLSPGLQLGLSGVLPMAALIGYLLVKSPAKSPDPAATKSTQD